MKFTAGHTKKGGRKAGTPNKRTAFERGLVRDLLKTYAESGKMTEDFCELEARDRLAIAERLMQYVIPKMQATQLDLSDNTTLTIEDRLKELSEPVSDH